MCPDIETIGMFRKTKKGDHILKYKEGTIAILTKRGKLTLAIPKNIPTRIKSNDGKTRLCVTFDISETQALNSLLDKTVEKTINMLEQDMRFREKEINKGYI